MRHSTARLADSPVRLADLEFPHDRVHVHRTRTMFVNLDNLLHFAKMDREGRRDAYIAAYLPDEVSVLFLQGGEVVSASAFDEEGRHVAPIGAALKHIRQAAERSELTFCDAPLEQLAWMYASCAAPAARRYLDPKQPAQLFPALSSEIFTGILEVITDGRVSYFRYEDGKLLNGYFGDAGDRPPLEQHIKRLFEVRANAPQPLLSAAVFPVADALPPQASPALIGTYREMFWAIAERAEAEVQGEGRKRAYRLRDELLQAHTALKAVGTPLDRDAPDVVATPKELVDALAAWVQQLLGQLEVIAPGIAPGVLREATRDHRFILQKAGFYDRLPWTVTW